MTDQQHAFDALLRASEINLSKADAVLAFELAKELIKNPKMGLREWSKVHCQVRAQFPKQAVTPPKPESQYSTFTTANNPPEWVKAC